MSAGIATERARRLLVGGLLGANVALLLSAGLGLAIGGPRMAGSVLLGAALVIFFFAVGQGAQVIVAERDPKVILVAALLSYGVRVAALGVVLQVFLTRTDRVAGIDRRAMFVGVAASLVGWLAFEIVAYRRLRIPVYDTEPPVAASGMTRAEDG